MFVFSHILCISWYYVYKLYNACCILCHWVCKCDALLSWWSVGHYDLNWKVIAIRWLGLFRVNVEYRHGMIYLQAVGQMAKILPILQNFTSQYQQIDSSNHGIYIYFFFWDLTILNKCSMFSSSPPQGKCFSLGSYSVNLHNCR